MRFGRVADARRYLWECMAKTLRADVDNGSHFLNEDDFDDYDRRRIAKATQQVIASMLKRSEKP